MKLLIVESPNKVDKIGGILGADWKVAASVGHIRDLPTKEMGISEPDFTPHYVYTERGESVVERLRKLAAGAKEVYLATDPDREGEAIAWHIKECLKLKSYQRVTFTAITPEVIAEAIRHPRQLDNALVKAQEARRVLDRLVGYKVSRPLSDLAGKNGLSAGRVQSPAVRIVVERERAIQNFRETHHFGAEVSFENGAWTAAWDTKPYLEPDEEYILDQALAERAANCRQFVVTSASRKPAYTPPPAPFTTSTLLQAASVTLGFNPDSTARVAQKLFEQGLITYHRTDSQNFADEALSEIRGFANAAGWPIPAKARKWKSKDSAQEAHEAIRPTHLSDRAAGATPDEQSLYTLIWLRAVASQLSDAEYSATTLNLESGTGQDIFKFTAKGRTLVNAGWKALTEDAANEEQEENPDDKNKVPLLREGATPVAETGRVLNKKTKPPSRFTEASLIKQLERLGIGRPSTYAQIIKNITTRGYLTLSKKFLIPAETGYQIVDALAGNFLFMDYAFTKNLEEDLDLIQDQAGYHSVVSRASAQLQKEIDSVRASRPATPRTFTTSPSAGIAKCPKCHQGQISLRANSDPSKAFWCCNQYKADKTGCDFRISNQIAQKTLTETNVKQLCEKGRTSSPLKGFKSKLGKPFEAHLKIDAEHKVVFEFADRKA